MFKVIFGIVYFVIGLLNGGFMLYACIRYKGQYRIFIKDFLELRSFRCMTYVVFGLYLCLSVTILWPIMFIAIALLLYDDTFPAKENQKPEEGNEESE